MDSGKEKKVLKPAPVKKEKGKTNVKTFSIVEKVNLKEELQEEFGNYLVTLNDSTLQLIDPAGLYNPFYSFDTTDLKSSLIGFELKLLPHSSHTYEFSKKDSKIRLQYWKVEELTAEYTELNGINITGKIRDNNIKFSSRISFGMSLKEFFAIFFDNYNDVIGSVKTIVVWEDERGDTATVYYFKNGLLSTIEFGNHSY